MSATDVTIGERLVALRQSLGQWSQMRMVASEECWEMFHANEVRVAQLMDTKQRLGRILEK